MFHILGRRCVQAAFKVQSFPVRLLHRCFRSPTEAPPRYSCLQGAFFQSVKPTLVHPSLMCVSITQSRSLHISPQCLKKRKAAEEPEPRELDLLRYDMKSMKDSPKPALYLGAAGLIPFVSVPLIMGVTEVYYPELAFAQLAYGASILCFLGGIRWGFAIPDSSPAKLDWMNLASGTVPPLMACIALIFRDHLTEATILLIMGFGVALHYDLSLLPTYPSWFKSLEAILTVVAVFSLVATLVASSSYPEKPLPSLLGEGNTGND